MGLTRCGGRPDMLESRDDHWSKTMKIFGIPNCATVKKARTWLEEHQLAVPFHDYKKQGVPADRLCQWVGQVSWEKLVNRQGTTWRKLPDARKAQVIDRESAIELMLEYPSVIKRPVLEHDGLLLVGFDPAAYQAAFAAS